MTSIYVLDCEFVYIFLCSLDGCEGTHASTSMPTILDIPWIINLALPLPVITNLNCSNNSTDVIVDGDRRLFMYKYCIKVEGEDPVTKREGGEEENKVNVLIWKECV